MTCAVILGTGRKIIQMVIDDRKPLVSVIVPVYNVKPYICESLNSIINQTYQNIELIIVDDGSEDGSSNICDEYAKCDSRICVVHQENKGLSSARNTGLNIMHGDIVAFLDPDDVYLPKMLETLIKSMIAMQADIAVCSFYIYYTFNGKRASHYDSIYPTVNSCITNKKALNLLMDDKLSIGVWSKIYKKELFDGLRFPDGYVFEDQIITPLLLERAHKIVTINEPLILHWRNRPGSITATINEKNMLDNLRAVKIRESFVLEHTPSIYSVKKANDYRNRVFCGIIGQYVKIVGVSESISEATRRVFQDEIQNRAKTLNEYSLKTKLFYYAYRVNPKLCYHLKSQLKKFAGFLMRESHD